MTLSEEQIFKEELDAIEEAIKEMDDLYLETKTHFDSVKNSGHQRSLSFIHLQTSNLISLKNSKLSMLKEKAALKKAGIELELKTKTPESEGNSEAIKELYKMIINSQEIKTSNEYSSNEEEDGDDDIEDILASRVSDIRNKKDGVKKEKYKICVQVKDKRWKFVAVNESGEIVKDAVLPNKKDHKLRLKTVDGKKIAVNQDDKIFDIV